MVTLHLWVLSKETVTMEWNELVCYESGSRYQGYYGLELPQ